MGQSIARIDQNVINQEKNAQTFYNSIETNLNQRIVDLEKLVRSQVEMQAKIVRVQEQQAGEIKDIKETLKSFADIREKVAAQEERLRSLESVHKTASEIRKEKIKSNATIITAVVSAISAVIAAIIAAVV